MSQQVVFLELPVVGRCVRFFINGRYATSSPVASVVPDTTRTGWYIICTTSGNEYWGPVYPNFQPTTVVSQPQTFSGFVQELLPPARPVPQEIAYGLNWGAFLLTPIWSCAHRVWLGLLSLLPWGIGLIVALILLFKGNEWGWRCRQFYSVEHFRAVQRIWTIWGIVVWTFIIIVLGLLFFLSLLSPFLFLLFPFLL